MDKVQAKKATHRAVRLILDGQAKIDFLDWIVERNFSDRDAQRLINAYEEITQNHFNRSN